MHDCAPGESPPRFPRPALPQGLRRRPPPWLIIATGALCAGCAGYQVGTRSLYEPTIATVYVPVFESDSYRPNLGERLTEAVVKQIELKTPYKVADSANADSILTGRIVTERKRVVVEDSFGEPRDTGTTFSVEVRWLTRSGRQIRDPATIALPADLVQFGQETNLIAEAGQSIATAHQQAVERLAEQIVAAMEVPW